MPYQPVSIGGLAARDRHEVRDLAGPFLRQDIPIAGVAHQAGTCRFGTDPAASVLDANCKAHELDNLYVADTSFFPSIGAVNPALTAIANAIRVGEHIAERLGVSIPMQARAPAPRTAPAAPASTPRPPA